MEPILSPSLDPRARGKLAREIKFVVSPELAAEVHTWARVHLEPDPCGTGRYADAYSITSLYLDTKDYDVLRRQGSFARAKYRIRRYGESAAVYLERKLKNQGLVGKRRTAIDEGLLDLLAKPPAGDWAGDWFHRRVALRQLAPICQISYQRHARLGRVPEGNIRLTIDDQIRAWPVARWNFVPNRGGTPLNAGFCIVEIKYKQQLPALFEQLLLRYPLAPANLSKLRLAGSELGFVPLAAKKDWRSQPCLIS